VFVFWDIVRLDLHLEHVQSELDMNKNLHLFSLSVYILSIYMDQAHVQ
jgi:hypothetical protein